MMVEVAGGQDAINGQFPFVVSLQESLGVYRDEWLGFYRHLCGGTLISDRVVLTAAHCFWLDNYDQRGQKAAEGELERDLYGAVGPYCRHMSVAGQRHKVIKFYQHPDYSGHPRAGNDIALLVLEEGATDYEGTTIQYKTSGLLNIADLQPLVAVGWGATNTEERQPQIFLENVKPLQVGNLFYVDENQCTQQLNNASDPSTAPLSSTICAFNGQQDTCIGDSGGPLLYTDSGSSQSYQVGITSWGPDTDCGNVSELPGVYTNVQYFEEWIDGTLEKIKSDFPELANSIDEIVMPNTGPVSVTADQQFQSLNPNCLLDIDYGFGEGYILSYYFNKSSGQCQEFGWSGLGNNENNFRTKEDCEKTCNSNL
eukprot:TRINITY_DN23128_c0_g1_i2.p1 TRINITY_DN23128_c0_g1~~TRINITY_DN23128_c0_g1_i2.p1  ORF type:complete len:429 (-),score=36.00 TRINITY_DN23128_c0_g1_i2:1295-2401(-)